MWLAVSRILKKFGGGESFSMSATLREDIHAAYENRTRKDALIPLCTSPRVFGMLGLEQADIVTEARTIRKLYGKGLSEDEIVQAVEQFDDALAIIKDSDNSVILFPGMLAKNQSGELSDVQSAIHLQRTNDGEHYMASLYALDNYQKIEAQLKQGHLIYSKYTKEDLEANNGALGQKTGVSPTLVRLLTSQGLPKGEVTTKDDLVKAINSEIPNLSQNDAWKDSFSMRSKEVKNEMKEIADAAKKNGTYLKAPNGESTKLTPELWTLVRTQAFKAWFGDWEKVATFNAGIEKLEKMKPVSSITGQEFAQTGMNDLVQRVVDYWAQHGNVAHSPMLGAVNWIKPLRVRLLHTV